MHEEIRDFKCQAYEKKFTAQRNTVLYRLKSHSGLVEKIIWLLVLGWMPRRWKKYLGCASRPSALGCAGAGCSGCNPGKKLHERFVEELELIHVQHDELWANVKNGGQDMWLWMAHDAKTKLIPVLQVGDEVRRWCLQLYTNLREGWLCSGFQQGWITPLLLCLDGPFWEVGMGRRKKAGLGAIE